MTRTVIPSEPPLERLEREQAEIARQAALNERRRNEMRRGGDLPALQVALRRRAWTVALSGMLKDVSPTLWDVLEGGTLWAHPDGRLLLATPAPDGGLLITGLFRVQDRAHVTRRDPVPDTEITAPFRNPFRRVPVQWTFKPESRTVWTPTPLHHAGHLALRGPALPQAHDLHRRGFRPLPGTAAHWETLPSDGTLTRLTSVKHFLIADLAVALPCLLLAQIPSSDAAPIAGILFALLNALLLTIVTIPGRGPLTRPSTYLERQHTLSEALPQGQPDHSPPLPTDTLPANTLPADTFPADTFPAEPLPAASTATPALPPTDPRF